MTVFGENSNAPLEPRVATLESRVDSLVGTVAEHAEAEQAALDTEATARHAGDDALDAAIAAERDARLLGDQSNNDQLGDLIQRVDLLVAQGKGDDGRSAYDVAVANGFVGNQAAWLASLIGPAGQSAYQVAVAAGFVGNQAAWLASLIGPAGQSAYQLAVAGGFIGNQAAWLASLIGPAGGPGPTPNLSVGTVGTGPIGVTRGGTTGNPTLNFTFPATATGAGATGAAVVPELLAALAPGYALKFALFADGAKTFSSGSNVSTITSSDASGTVFSANDPAYIFAGAVGKYVTFDGANLVFPRTAGLQYTPGTPIVAKATNLVILWRGAFVPPDFVMNTTRAAALAAVAAAPATYPQGTVIQVTGDSNVASPTPRDVTDTTDCGYDYNASRNGVYDVDVGNAFVQTIAVGNPQSVWSLVDSTDSFKIITYTVEVNGQGVIVALDRVAGFIVTLRIPGEKLRLTGSMNDFALSLADGFMTLYVNGEIVDRVQVTLTLTNLNCFYLNGRGRAANVNVPVDGTHHKLNYFVLAEGA